MSVMYIALPLALGLGAAALWGCIYCIRSGQFEDLETPPMRMLIDEEHSESASETDSE
jgi:cbb3-type cytochrome oxidase maturation protein